VKKSTQKHKGVGDNVLGNKIVNNYDFRIIGGIAVLVIFMILVAILVLMPRSQPISETSTILLTEAEKGPTFEENTNELLQILILPFNSFRDCNTYTSNYEYSFYHRLSNLAEKYEIPIQTRIFNCEKNFDDRKIYDEITEEYPGYNAPPELLYHNAAVVNNADLVVYGIYEENCNDSLFVNVNGVVSLPMELLELLSFETKEKEEIDSCIAQEIFLKFYPNALQTSFGDYTKTLKAKDKVGYSKFKKLSDIGDLENSLEIDRVILNAFARFELQNGRIQQCLSIYRSIIDDLVSGVPEIMIYAARVGEAISRTIDQLREDKDYQATIDLIGHFRTNYEGYYIESSLVSSLNATMSFCYYQLKDYEGLNKEIQYQKSVSQKSAFHLVSCLYSSIYTLSRIDPLEYPDVFVNTARALQEVLGMEKPHHNLLSFAIRHFAKSEISKVNSELLVSDCLYNVECLLNSYYSGSLESMFNLQQFFDYSQRIQGVRHICEEDYTEAYKHFESIEDLKVNDYLYMAQSSYKLGDLADAISKLKMVQRQSEKETDQTLYWQATMTIMELQKVDHNAGIMEIVEPLFNVLCD